MNRSPYPTARERGERSQVTRVDNHLAAIFRRALRSSHDPLVEYVVPASSAWRLDPPLSRRCYRASLTRVAERQKNKKEKRKVFSCAHPACILSFRDPGYRYWKLKFVFFLLLPPIYHVHRGARASHLSTDGSPPSRGKGEEGRGDDGGVCPFMEATACRHPKTIGVSASPSRARSEHPQTEQDKISRR